MGILSRLGKGRKAKAAASRAYTELVSAARAPGMYGKQGIPDTEAGRFDALLLWLAILIRRLRSDGDQADRFLRNVIGEFALDMDRTVREAGVGDLGVGKRVKQMVAALHARADTIEDKLNTQAVAAGKLDEYVIRTIFDGETDAADRSKKIAAAAVEFAEALDRLKTEEIVSGTIPAPR